MQSCAMTDEIILWAALTAFYLAAWFAKPTQIFCRPDLLQSPENRGAGVSFLSLGPFAVMPNLARNKEWR
jgi:hypothetical protein